MSGAQGAAGGAASRPALRLVARDERRGTTVVREVGPEGLTIGRTPENGMALPDLDRFVSGRHAVIDHADGLFRVTDTSTNGTYINGATTPLGAGQTRVLRPGDRLRIGLYEILVEAPEAPAATPAPPAAAVSADPVQAPALPAFTAAPVPAAASPVPDDAPQPAPQPAPRPVPPRPVPPPGGGGASDVLASLVSDLIGGAAAPEAIAVPAGIAAAPTGLPPRETTGAAIGAGTDPASVPVSPFAAFDTTARAEAAPLFGLARANPASPEQAPPDVAPPTILPPGVAATVGTPGTPASATGNAGSGVSLAIGDLLRDAATEPPGRSPPPPPLPDAQLFDAPPPPTPPRPALGADDDAAIAGQAIQLRLPGVSIDGRPADPATLALAAFWAGFGSFPGDLRASELPALMHQLGAALREACDGADDLLAEVDGGHRFAGGRAPAGRLRRLLADRNREGHRLDEAMRDAFERAAARRRAYEAGVEAGVHTVTDTLSAATLATRFTDVIRAIGRRRREAELWRLFTVMGNELKQLAELRFQKEVDAHMRRHDEQRLPPGPLP